MLIVAPTGKTKRVTRRSTPKVSSKQRNVIGKVAEPKSILKRKSIKTHLMPFQVP
jgi:hypothetical protein